MVKNSRLFAYTDVQCLAYRVALFEMKLVQKEKHAL